MFKGIFGDKKRVKNFVESVLVGNKIILPRGTKIKRIEYIKIQYIQSELRANQMQKKQYLT